MLLPLLTNPALIAIAPDFAVFDVLLAEDAGENHLAHIPCHRIVHQHIISHLINTNKHHGNLGCRLPLNILQGIQLNTLSDSVNF